MPWDRCLPAIALVVASGSCLLATALGASGPPPGAEPAAGEHREPAAGTAPLSSTGEQAPRVEDLAWLAGRWVGEIGGQPVEEHWSAPAGGAMMGMFRWLRGGEPFLYEHFLLEPGAEGPVLHLRHFHPGSIAWEEKDAPVPFTLVSLASETCAVEAVFEDRAKDPPVRLTYRLEGDSDLLVFLDTWRGERPLRLEFRYRRAEGPAGPGSAAGRGAGGTPR